MSKNVLHESSFEINYLWARLTLEKLGNQFCRGRQQNCMYEVECCSFVSGIERKLQHDVIPKF